MTAAVILTECHTTHKRNSVQNILKDLEPFFEEKILITHQPSLYLPFVKDQVRILTPYFEGTNSLSSLHTSLSLAVSDEVWLLHESNNFPGIHIFNEMKKAKKHFHTQAVLFQEDSKTCLVYSLFDKSVLSVLQEQLSRKNNDIGQFLHKINYVLFQEQEKKSL